MTQWNTPKIIASLEKLKGVKKVNNLGQGGDVDTDNLEIVVEGSKDSLFICGFVHSQPDGCIDTPDNADVDAVELTDGKDSRGGLNSHNKHTAAVYAEIHTWLCKKKFDVVTTIKDYF